MKDLVNDGFAQVVKPYIDAQDTKTRKMLAPVEPDETDASQAYAIGDQLILDGILYDVIAAIAQHGIITATGSGANIAVATDLSGQFTTLKNAFTNNEDILGAKNFLDYSTLVSQQNTTVTADSETGVITLTATKASAFADAFIYPNFKENLRGKSLICKLDSFVGGTDWRIYIYLKDSTGATIGSSMSILPTSTTKERTFTVDPNTAYIEIRIRMAQDQSQQVGDVMTVTGLRLMLASEIDTTYVPYAKGNQQLTQETTGLLENVNVLGAKNLAKYSLTANPYTSAGTVFTEQEDKSITITGTYDGSNHYVNLNSQLVLDAGTYILTDGDDGGLPYVRLRDQSNNLIAQKEQTFTLAEKTTVQLQISFGGTSGATANSKLYPMIRLASNPDDTYVPYAMSNKELTDLWDTNKWTAETSLTQGSTKFDYTNATIVYRVNPFTRRVVARIDGVVTTDIIAKNTPLTIANISADYKPPYTIAHYFVINYNNVSYIVHVSKNGTNNVMGFSSDTDDLPAGATISTTFEWSY